MKKLKVAFCGTPDFSVPVLELLHNHPSIDLVSIITMPDRPAGRGKKLKSPPVADFAKENRIPLIQTENINREPEALDQLEQLNIDMIVVLAFAQFLGKRVLALPKIACFNIHTSILPKYRGAAPIQYALLNGDKTTGVSIQRMVKKMDAGDLVLFDELSIGDNETGGQLYTRLKFQAALSMNDLIVQVLEDKVKYTPQNENEVSFATTLKKEDGHLHFSEKSFDELFNCIRALKPWPGTFGFLNEKRLKIFEIEKNPKKLTPGQIYTDMGTIVIGTKTDSARLTVVQLEGKKICTDVELLNGLRNKLDIKEIIID